MLLYMYSLKLHVTTTSRCANLIFVSLPHQRPHLTSTTNTTTPIHRQLAQQPSKLPDFISFRLEVRGVRQQQEDLLVALPAQVSDLYAAVTAWGFRLPHTDQVGGGCGCGCQCGRGVSHVR